MSVDVRIFRGFAFLLTENQPGVAFFLMSLKKRRFGRAARARLGLGVQYGTARASIGFMRTENSDSGPGANGGAFATTVWSVVAAAGDASAAAAQPALEQLCRSYWYPLYAHVRRRGYSREDAEDLTQAFFARLLTHESLSLADSSRGPFRCFLLAGLNHFLANEWNKARAEKRGGDRSHLSFDTASAEQLYGREDSCEPNPEELYERSWALQFLDHVQARVRHAYVSAVVHCSECGARLATGRLGERCQCKAPGADAYIPLKLL